MHAYRRAGRITRDILRWLAMALYVSGGAGFISVFAQLNADKYQALAQIPTAEGARTSLFVPALGRLYLAVPHRGTQASEVRVYEVQ